MLSIGREASVNSIERMRGQLEQNKARAVDQVKVRYEEELEILRAQQAHVLQEKEGDQCPPGSSSKAHDSGRGGA